jgi:hypothetical protein
MLVDDYEQFNNDRTDVVLVSHSGSEEEQEAELLASDCTDYLPISSVSSLWLSLASVLLVHWRWPGGCLG